MSEERTMINSALALKTKISLLAWIGILPASHAALAKTEVFLMHKALEDAECPQDIKNEAMKHIPKVHDEMNQGINIIIAKLDSDACVKCGKCEDLNEILHMLLNDVDIHTINSRIEESYGDVAAINGRGMPGEPGQGFPATPIVLGGGTNGLGIEDLINRLFERSPDVSMDRTESMGPRSMNPIKSLLDSLFGPPVDKNKLI